MRIDSLKPLAAGTDIDHIFDRSILGELAVLIHTYESLASVRRSLADLEGRPDDEVRLPGATVGELRELFRAELDQSARVTAVQALRANHLATQQLSSGRYEAIRAARADGVSWSSIGDALGMSKQGAQDWYNKRSVPMFQDHAPAE